MLKRILSNFIRIFPGTRFFLLKRLILRCSGFITLSNVRVVSSVKFQTSGKVFIGKNSWIGHEVLFVGGGDIIIGNDVDIAPRVMLVTGSHEINAKGLKAAGDGYSLPINIGDGCWIGAGAIVMGGSEICSGAIVAAGSLVKGRVPPYSIVAGVPARIVRFRLIED